MWQLHIVTTNVTSKKYILNTHTRRDVMYVTVNINMEAITLTRLRSA